MVLVQDCSPSEVVVLWYGIIDLLLKLVCCGLDGGSWGLYMVTKTWAVALTRTFEYMEEVQPHETTRPDAIEVCCCWRYVVSARAQAVQKHVRKAVAE